MCNEVTTWCQTGQRLSWKQRDESKVLHMKKKSAGLMVSRGQRCCFYTVMNMRGETSDAEGKKRGGGVACHTKQMKVSECIIQEAGQGMFENIFKRTAGSLPASVCVLNIGTASSIWRNWYWLNNLSQLRLNPPRPPKLLTSRSKSFINCCLLLVWRSSVSGEKKKVFVFGQRVAKEMWWCNLVTYWSWRRPTVNTQLVDRVNL